MTKQEFQKRIGAEMCLSRLKREDAPELEIRKQLSQEMGREEN